MQVGKRIRELRKAANLTQEQLSKGIIARTYISQLEKGVYNPSYETLEKLAKRLGCDVETFYEEPQNNILLKADSKKIIYKMKNLIESKFYTQAKKLLEELNKNIDHLNKFDRGICHWINGEILYYEGRYNEALKEYNICQEIFYHLQSFEEYVSTLVSISKIHQKNSEIVKALQFLQKGHNIIYSYSLSGEVKKNLLLELGKVHGKLDEYKTAIYHLEQLKLMNITSGNHYRAGALFMSLGICYRSIGEYDKALECYYKAIEFYKIEEDKENIAALYNNLGNIYTDCSKILEAINFYYKSIDLYLELGIGDNILFVKSGLAKAYYVADQFENCINVCNEIIRNSSKQTKTIGKAYFYLGLANIKLDSFTEAINYLEKATKIFLISNSKKNLIKAYKEIGKIYEKLGDYENSSLYYKKALQYYD